MVESSGSTCVATISPFLGCGRGYLSLAGTLVGSLRALRYLKLLETIMEAIVPCVNTAPADFQATD